MARLYSECIRCQVKSNLERIPAQATEEQKVKYLQRMLKIIAETEKDVSAPIISRDLEQLRFQMFGVRREYAKEKVYYNDLMLTKEEELQKQIRSAENPLLRAVQYAMVGNYIDFAAVHDVREEELNRYLNQVEEQCPINAACFEELTQKLSTAESLLYLTDNCGEIVLDKLLIKLLKEQYPQLAITVMVRGEAVLNDAAMEDAIQVGLPDMVRVVDNGTNIAGTWMREMPEAALQELKSADLILAKGQGNFESMQGCGLNVYYIFLCKCKLFAEAFQVPPFTGMLIHDRDALDKRKR